jgi:hypothetical protein
VNLLEKYIRLLLIEGRLEDVIKKYSNYHTVPSIKLLAQKDPSGNNKYLMWMMDQYDKNNNDYELIIDLVNKFYKNQQRLKGDKRDLYKYNSLSDLESELSKVPDKSKRQQKKAVKREGADIVFENDEVVVLIPKTHEASCYYGSNTKWCTASKDDSSYFDDYLEEVTLYYILPKDGGEKVAVAVDEHNNKEIFDSGDNGERLSWLEDKLQQYNISSSIFKYIPLTGVIKRGDGGRHWFLNGKRHRIGGPAIVRPNGRKEWYLNGKRHRTDGPAVERADGYKAWLLNGKRHRTDGPAIVRPNGTKAWYLNGKRHRTDGPAVEYSDGHKEWWLNGMEYPEDKYWQKVGLDKKEEYYKGLKK